MDVRDFWQLTCKTRTASNGDVSRQAHLLIEELVQLSVNEILAYDTIMKDLKEKAYDVALWDAADIIGCGCSDDGFSDFRAWLISQGKETYERVLADPESLVDMIDVDKDGQEGALLYVVITAYKQKTGQDKPPIDPQLARSPQLKGTHWPEEDRKARFPKLAAKFGDCEKRWKTWLHG